MNNKTRVLLVVLALVAGGVYLISHNHENVGDGALGFAFILALFGLT